MQLDLFFMKSWFYFAYFFSSFLFYFAHFFFFYFHWFKEQQTVSIAKAGIICTLNARTSILASANPKNSRYERNLSVVENLDLVPSLLSRFEWFILNFIFEQKNNSNFFLKNRFDMIYIILDIPKDSSDRKLASHIISLYQKSRPPQQKEMMDVELLSAYISYAREKIVPEIGNEASEHLVKKYVGKFFFWFSKWFKIDWTLIYFSFFKDMRKIGRNSKTITATPRQLESLIRISEALAKMRLSTTVEKRDVDEAVRYNLIFFFFFLILFWFIN